MTLFLRFFFVAGMVLWAAAARAEIRLPSIIGDNMALQADKAVPIWGWGSAGETVAVAFQGHHVSGLVDAEGRWSVMLPALRVDATGQTLTVVSGENEVAVGNVVVGDVWLASGQSNMALEVEQSDRAEEEIAAATHPTIRLFTVKQAVAVAGPLADCEGRWVECAPETVGAFSAVGYFFARDLQATLDRPVGVIHSSWGGTKAKVWLPQAALDERPELQVINDAWAAELADYPRAKAEFDAHFPALQTEWEAVAAAAIAAGKAPPAGPRLRTGPNSQYVPAALYNAMIAPLIPYGLSGYIWYQGESDVGAPQLYAETLVALAHSWRGGWQDPSLAFICVQLPNIDRQPEPSRSGWAELREAQLKLLSVPDTALVVTIDVGDPGSVHPTHKPPVGHRVALAAQALVHGADRTRTLSPVPRAWATEGDAMRIRFDHVADALRTSDGGEGRGFVVAGPDRIFHPAQVRLAGDGVVVSSPMVPQPAAVRYGWADNPPCNIVDGAGLPVTPFRTDTWATPALVAHELDK
mgnify:FL=1